MFLADIPKFNPDIYTIVSFDAVKLYTNVNTNRVVSLVLDTIYKSPDLYFKEKNDEGVLLPFPSRSNFRIFIQNILKNFNISENNLGFFRQKGGLAMGSPISGSLSNLFIHMMEKTIINKLIKEKTIQSTTSHWNTPNWNTFSNWNAFLGSVYLSLTGTVKKCAF